MAQARLTRLGQGIGCGTQAPFGGWGVCEGMDLIELSWLDSGWVETLVGYGNSYRNHIEKHIILSSSIENMI